MLRSFVRRTGDLLAACCIRLGAGVAYLVLYHVLGRTHLDPGAGYWDRIRAGGVSVGSRLFGGVLHTDRPIRETEFVGTLDRSPAAVATLLWDRGFHRNPVAAVKTRDGTPEVGSWVRRDRPLSRRQLHVMLFRNPDGDRTDVYAHEEFSSVNPRVAVRHYHGVDQREARGVEMTRRLLPFDSS